MYYVFIVYQDDVISKLIEWGTDEQEGSNEEDDSSIFLLMALDDHVQYGRKC